MMLDILFKQLGFNPADLKKQVADAADNLNKVITHFNNRIDRLEEQNRQIIILLKGNPNETVLPQIPHKPHNPNTKGLNHV